MVIQKLITLFQLLLVLVFVSGCISQGAIVVPDRFSSAKEVYSLDVLTLNENDLPAGSYKGASFNAPYEDVFRAVTESTGQALLNIETSSEDNGLILATKAAKVRNAFASQINQAFEAEQRHYFAIIIKEKGPETTDVKIITKVQSSCQYNSWFGEEECAAEATVKYSTDFWHSAATDMNNFIIFVRNNLYAAGVL